MATSVFYVCIRYPCIDDHSPRDQLPWRPGACACNVYQALSPPPPLEGPGYEATRASARTKAHLWNKVQSIYNASNFVRVHCQYKDAVKIITVFPRNLAAARFYFKAPFGAATIRGQLDFEGGVYRDRYARTYTASIISLVVCT